MITPRAQRALWVTAIALFAMGILWAPPFLKWDVSGWGDWQAFHHMWESARVAIVRWHEAPLWNAYQCGGASLWGNPQNQMFSPTWLATGLPFGTMLGHKLFLFFHAIVGWTGMYFVCRRVLSFSPLAAFFSATVWCASGFFAWHGAGGHSTFLAFYYGPFLLYAWRRSVDDMRWCAAVAGWMGLIVAEGGHYPFPYFVVWLGFDLILRLPDRRWWRMLAAAAVSGVLTMFVGAFRFIPILLTVREHPHVVIDLDHLTLAEILQILTARTFDYQWGHRWVWPEYGAFVGWTVIVLGGLGAAILLAQLCGARARLPRREILALLLGLALFLLLTQGREETYYPWPLLQKLPVYRSIHVPSRWRVMLIFYLALVSGYALDAIARWLGRVPAPRTIAGLALAVPWIVALGACADIYSVNLPIIDRWDGPVLERDPAPRFYLVRGRNFWLDYEHYPSENVGTNECYDPIPWEVSPFLWLGPGPQARIEPDSSGEVEDWGRSNLTTWADVHTSGPATIVFNQNIGIPRTVVFDHDIGSNWSTNAGEIVEDRGRLAVRLDRAYHGRVLARYSPADLPYSVGLSIVGAIGCIAIALRAKRRYGRSTKPRA